jgi:hypothetical protein
VNTTAKERSCGYDDTGTGESTSFKRLDARYAAPVFIENEARNRALNCLKSFMLLDERSDGASVETTIALSARGPHCWTFAAVEHSELKRRKIGSPSHYSTKRVHFPDDCSLGDSTDCGIARHLANRLESACDETDGCPGTSSGNCCFCSGVACANHDYVEMRFGEARVTYCGHTLKLITPT